MRGIEYSSSKEVAEATKAYQSSFKVCLNQAKVNLSRSDTYRACIRLNFRHVLADTKAAFIPKDLSEFVNSRFAGTLVEIHEIEATREHLIIRVIPTGSNPWEEHKKLIFLGQEERAARNSIWINIFPRIREPYQGMFTYEDCLYSASDILQDRIPKGEPKPVVARVILAVAQMLPDPTYKRNLFRSFVATHPLNKHLWQPERKVEVSL